MFLEGNVDMDILVDGSTTIRDGAVSFQINVPVPRPDWQKNRTLSRKMDVYRV